MLEDSLYLLHGLSLPWLPAPRGDSRASVRVPCSRPAARVVSSQLQQGSSVLVGMIAAVQGHLQRPLLSRCCCLAAVDESSVILLHPLSAS